MSKKNVKPYNRKTMVPITINGAEASLDVTTIPKDDWKPCHGPTKAGIEVNSLNLAFRGDMAIVRRSDGFVASYNADEFDVLTAKYQDARAAALKSQTA